MKDFLIVTILLIGLASCEKGSGEGGTSVIEGKVMYFKRDYNATTFQVDTIAYPKAGKDVFIIYSDDEGEVYDADFETDYNGRYRFEFLRKGNYTIYTHKDTTVIIAVNPDGSVIDYSYDIPIYKHLEIKENNSVNTITDFLIENN